MSVNTVLILVVLAFNGLILAALAGVLAMHPRPFLARESVRSLAAGSLPSGTRRARVRRWIARHQGWGALVVFAGVLAITFVPDLTVSISPLRSAHNAEGYLQTLWQVLAAVLGISIVLVALVLEGFVSKGERRHGGTLLEFASDTGVLFAIDLAAASLVTIGIVLQGNLRSAPAGWAGAMAILFSGIALVSLLTVLPRRILRAIDPDELRRMRSVRVNRAVEESVREQIVGQLGDDQLLRNEPQWRVKRGFVAAPHALAIRARRDGYLQDIRVGVLRRVAHRLPEGGVVEILSSAGDRVQQGQALASLPDGAGAVARWRTRRVLVIRRHARAEATHTLNRLLDRLGQQGLAAIRAREETELREINAVYCEILVKLPTVTHEFAIPFEGAVSHPGLMGRGPMSRVLENLLDGVREVLRSNDPGIASAVAYTFIRVAGEATNLNAPGMIRACLGEYTGMYLLARRDLAGSGETETNRLLLQESVDQMFEGVKRVSGYGAVATLAALDEQSALTNLRAGLRPVQGLIKAIISNGEIGRLQRALKSLREVMEPWIDAQYDSEPAVALLGEVDGMMLLLAMWAADRYRRSAQPSEDPSGSMLALLLGAFTSGDQVVTAYELVNNGPGTSFGEGWGFWFYDTDQGGVQNVGGEAQVDRAAVLALLSVAASGTSLTLPVGALVGYRGDGVLAALEEIAADQRWRTVLPTLGAPEPAPQGGGSGQNLFDACVASVRQAFEAARTNRDEANRDRVRQANLDTEQVQRFRRATIQNAASSRVIRDLMAHSSATRAVAPPVESPLLSREWIHKGFFIGDRSFVGQDMTARDLARRANVAEVQALREILVEDAPTSAAERDLRDAVVATIREMHSAGHDPSLIVVPLGFELAQALQVQAFGKVKLEVKTIPAAHAAAFRGAIEDVPVLQDVRIAAERLFVIDLKTAARFEEWPSEAGAGLEVEVRSFDAEQAAAFVTEHPGVISDGQTVEETTKILEGQALIEMHRCWRVASNDPAGIRAIEIPVTLRREIER